MAASLWCRLVTCHAHGHANIRDLQPHCEYPHTIQTLLYSVEFHKLYKTPSFIVDSISYTFIHSNLLDIRQFYRGNNNLNILFHGNSIFDTNNMRKFSFHIFWRMGPDKQLPSSILVTKQQFPSRIQVVCWEAAILLLRSCKNDTGKVLQLYWDGAVKLPNSMMPNCCWDRAGLIFKQYFSSALKRSCILYVYYTGPF